METGEHCHLLGLTRFRFLLLDQLYSHVAALPPVAQARARQTTNVQRGGPIEREQADFCVIVWD